ncbi:cobyrinate a,c-diamide synthase [Taurinivorans muris]|uniref:Cobyrinate a,c-diamide synthase n=1 Tax=Taurinivorans muris TaxID=2787751 RepID=A0ABY5Y4R6_9BACT|nr:cobyrinate a,c-diamide synthase [Desulfovibrionaceae bacterium LT0009]
MFSAFCLTAPNSGSGKTTLSIGLMRLLAKKNAVQAFKCGPDYIDTSYHNTASFRTSYNLDTWLMGEEEVQAVFQDKTKNCDIAIIEGVMGLFDGKFQKKAETKRKIPSIPGSTAHIAQILSLPLIMVIDCKGMAQSISAVVRGFYEQSKEYGLNLAGIIANNVGSEKHYAMLKESLETWNLPPLLGYLPKNSTASFKERQLGLSHIFRTNPNLEKNIDELAAILSEHIDIEKLLSVTQYAPPSFDIPARPIKTSLKISKAPKIGIAYDEAFCFYYPQNIEALKRMGYACSFFSPLKDKKLPNVEALYFGGGFPEIYAEKLSKNTQLRTEIKNFAEDYGDIFAECGGYMYLCSSLKIKSDTKSKTKKETVPAQKVTEQAKTKQYPLCNVFQATATMGNKLRSLGYREGIFLEKPFFWQNGQKTFHGHEFHWSDIELHAKYDPFLEVNQKPFGIRYKNVFASYMHFYFAHLLT